MSETYEIARRRKLLDVLLAGMWLFTLTILAALLVLVALGPVRLEESLWFYPGALGVLAGIPILFVINRRWSADLASVLLLILMTIAITFTDEPVQVVQGRALFMLTIPILLSSVLLRPWASFVMVGLISLLLTAIALGVPLGPDAVGSLPFTAGAFMIVALVAWLAARSLERALQDVHVTSAALRESEERFRLMAETSSDLLFQLDLEGQVTYCSPAVERVLGLAPTEVVGTHLARYFPVDQLAQAMANFERATAESVMVIAAEVVGKAGTPIMVEAYLVPIVRDGRVVGVQGTARDVSERKQAEAEIRASERLLRTITAHSNSYLSIIEKDLTLGYTAGKEFARQEQDPASFVGLTLEQVFGEQAPTVREHYMRAFAGAEVEFELYFNGEYQHYTAVPLVDEHGAIPRILSVVENITERKQAQDQLQRHAQELEERVVERTAQLQDQMAEAARLNRALSNLLGDLRAVNRHLETVRQNLQEANEELEAFAFSVAHDLREPLRGMESFAQALLDDYGSQLDALGRRYASRIIAATRQMDTLVRDLLSYSQLRDAQLQVRPVNLQWVVGEALAQLEVSIREQQAQITVQEPLPLVLGHHTTLTQVVANLLANAIKFVAPGVQP
ncbi:MAG: PAS domain S-box protein, partial [Chloroflexi bacterium]|nr:PAS domain S-box protein [Chloroflexota bacterium]